MMKLKESIAYKHKFNFFIKKEFLVRENYMFNTKIIQHLRFPGSYAIDFANCMG